MPLLTYLVEDNPLIRENLIASLEELTGVKVVDCADAEAPAIAWLCDRRNRWQLAVIDLFLREGTGLGVLSACPLAGTDHTLVVFTNYVTPEIRERALRLGATRVFDKSSEIDGFFQYCIDLAEGSDRRPLKRPDAEAPCRHNRRKTDPPETLATTDF